jgi:hypothetical protein
MIRRRCAAPCLSNPPTGTPAIVNPCGKFDRILLKLTSWIADKITALKIKKTDTHLSAENERFLLNLPLFSVLILPNNEKADE